MLTAKNLQCMRSILSVAHCHGNLLGHSWHIILTVRLINKIKKKFISNSCYVFFAIRLCNT